MRPELVGNFTRGNLRSGVISSVLDFTVWMVAWLGIIKKLEDQTFKGITKSLSIIQLLILRIEYLRFGLCNYFVSKGCILNTGSTFS